MRGSPLLRALVALFLMLALGVPLRHLLQPQPSEALAMPAETPRPEVTQKVGLHVEFTTPPTTLRVLSLGQEIWTATNPGPEVDRELTVAFPKEGVELQFECTWPEATRGAAKVRLTAPDGAEYVKYIFGQGETVDVLAFP